MQVTLVPSQRDQEEYLKFTQFVRNDLPEFVASKRSVHESLIEYGLLPAFVSRIPEIHHRGTIPHTPEGRTRFLAKTFTYGTPPEIVLGSHNVIVAEGNYAEFSPNPPIISLHKEVVLSWAQNPDDVFLHRAMISILLHEVVHYLNHSIVGGKFSPKYVNSGPLHLRNSFHEDAFRPLGWKRKEFFPYKHEYTRRGIQLN